MKRRFRRFPFLLTAFAIAGARRAAAITVATVQPPAGTAGAAYSVSLAASAGTPPYAWSLAGGALPAGLTLSASGVISGTPTLMQAADFTVAVRDLTSQQASWSFTLTVYAVNDPRCVTKYLPVGVQGVNFPQIVLRTNPGATGISVSAGSLPPGLTAIFDASFQVPRLIGNPTATGNYTVTFALPLSGGGSVNCAYPMSVAPPQPPLLWRERGSNGGSGAPVFSPSYATDRTAFLAGGQAEIYLSSDGGENWAGTALDATYTNYGVSGILPSPAFDYTNTTSAAAQTLFASTGSPDGATGRLYKTINRGATFTDLTAGLPCAAASACARLRLAISPDFATDATLFAAYGQSTISVLRSVNGGVNWSVVGTVSGGGAPTALLVAPSYPTDNILLLAADFGIYRSVNGGTTFTAVATGGLNGAYSSLVMSPAYATDRIVMGIGNNPTVGPMVMRSTDGGATFSALYYLDTEMRGGGGGTVRSVTVTARAGNTPLWYIAAWRGEYTIFSSDDGGATTTPIAGAAMTGKSMQYSVVCASAPQQANGASDLLCAHPEGAALSADNGFTFHSVNNGINLLSYGALSGAGASLIAMNSAQGIFKSVDTGANWSRSFLPAKAFNPSFYETSGKLLALSPNFAADGTIFYSTYSQLYRSTDGGNSFSQVFNYSYAISSISLAGGYTPAGGTVFLVSGNYLFKSTNGGLSFAFVTIPSPLCHYLNGTQGGFRSVAASPNYPADQTVFLSEIFQTGLSPTSVNSGTCKSTDGGATWTRLAGAADKSLYGVVSLPPFFNNTATATPYARMVFLGEQGGGLRYSTDGGATWTQQAGQPLAPANALGSVVVSPSYALDGVYFAYFSSDNAIGNGLWRGYGFGAQFQKISALSAGDRLFGRQVTGLFLEPGYDARNVSGIAVAVTAGSGVWRSTDNARTFAQVTSTNMVPKRTNAIVRAGSGALGISVQPVPHAVANDGYLYAAAGDGVYQSVDNGVSFTPLSAGLPANTSATAIAAPSLASTAMLTAVTGATGAPQGLWRYNGTSWAQQTGANLSATGNYTSFLEDGTYLYATNAAGLSVKSADGGATWTALQAAQTDLVRMDFNNLTTPTFTQPASYAKGPSYATGNTASLWAVSASGGPRWSADSGTTWTATPGTNDYTLPSGQSWSVVRALGINPVTNAREVIAGSATGLYLSKDGGVTWKSVSGPGSGLETTSKNFSATLSTATNFGTTDILVGATGATSGGVYLSGDGGEHWTQVNQGFDPGNLSISSLVKTSCAGCPVQYYSGTYGSGVYTRTISVNAPPQFPSVNYACAGAACTCGAGSFSGPVYGGTAVTLCGSNFQTGAAVEFDGLAASGCTVASSTTINCAGTPPHAAGFAMVRVRNPDTRAGTLPGNYQYLGGTSRADTLRVVKSGANAWVSWNCAGCTAGNPALLYRAQNAIFSLYLESYNGGASGTTTGGCTAAAGTTSCHNQTGAAGSAQSYFWSVE